jgi:hypothetical protein
MKIEFIYFVVLWLNAFHVKNGILVAYSLQEPLVHWKLDYTKHCWVLPGTYCEAHDKPVPSNTMVPHTYEAIVLGPTGNLHGSVKFYCLNTGRMLKWHSVTAQPMFDQAIKKVNAMGACKKQRQQFQFLN